jgi:hypothetical protein
MHQPIILADAEELLKAMGVVVVAGLFGAASLLGALLHFFSKDEKERKAAWLFLIVGVICFAPTLYLFVLPGIAHLLHFE